MAMFLDSIFKDILFLILARKIFNEVPRFLKVFNEVPGARVRF